MNGRFPGTSWTPPKRAVGPHVVELRAQVRDSVRGRDRRDRERREGADRLTGVAHEARSRVTGNAGRHGVDGAAPAAAVALDDDALLRAELHDALAKRGVAVGEDGVAEHRARAADRGRAAEARDGRIDGGHIGRVDLDEREVVVGAGVLVLLIDACIVDPGRVDERARAGRAVDLDRGAEGQRAGVAAVRVGGGARAGAVSRLAEVGATAVAEHEVGSALSAFGEGHDTRMDVGAVVGGRSLRNECCCHDGTCRREQDSVIHRVVYPLV